MKKYLQLRNLIHTYLLCVKRGVIRTYKDQEGIEIAGYTFKLLEDDTLIVCANDQSVTFDKDTSPAFGDQLLRDMRGHTTTIDGEKHIHTDTGFELVLSENDYRTTAEALAYKLSHIHNGTIEFDYGSTYTLTFLKECNCICIKTSDKVYSTRYAILSPDTVWTMVDSRYDASPHHLIISVRDIISVFDQINKAVKKTATEVSVTPKKLAWCRRNAPEAAKDLNDSELWDIMKDAYEEYHKGNDGATKVDKDINYMKLLQDLRADNATFTCYSGCGFLTSLEEDGYTEYLRTQSQDYCNKWQEKHEHRYNEPAPTSVASTGDIYVDTKDCYYAITITNLGDQYFVSVERRATSIMLEMV